MFAKKLFIIKKNGFTLIELLAVIVILAIILLIIMPIVLNIMSDARKGAFESTAMGLVKTAENQYMGNRLQGKSGAVEYIFNDWQQVGEEELEFSGRGAKDGTIKVFEDGTIEVAISDGEWCARKDAHETHVTVVSLEEDDCGLGEPGVHIVEYLAEELGSIDGESPQTILSGENTTPVTAIPNTDYSFVLWDDGYMSSNRQDFNVHTSFNTTAYFDLTANVTYQVNVVVNPVFAGTATLNGSTNGVFNPGESVTVEVTEVNAGYEFVRWRSAYSAELSTDLSYTFNVNKNKTIVAEFILDDEYEGPDKIDPEDPYDPHDPGYDPEEPYEPGDPIAPIDPGHDPEDPHDPGYEPEDPSNPYDPNNPGDSDIPTYPSDPWYPSIGDPCKGQESITIAGQEYDLVGIGTQCWMAENLNYDGHDAGNSWCYENENSNCNTYGRLYDWEAAVTACPEDQGAYLPSDQDFQTLEMSLGMHYNDAHGIRWRNTANVGVQLKTSSWGGVDAVGFRALPGGWRFDYEHYLNPEKYGAFLSLVGYGKQSFSKRKILDC